MTKIYSNVQLISEPNGENDIIKKKNLTEALFKKKSREVVDSEAYYSLETDSTLAGVKQVVTTITDANTQILLTDVNTQTTPVDLTSLVGDGTEYVLYHDKVVHEEEYEEPIYAKREDIPEGSITMSIDDWNDFSNNLVITASGYTE